MRCDVNVSIRPVGQQALGCKIEIKNLNSLRAAHRALVYEIQRQIEATESGESLRQETRRWDDAAGLTTVMRSKEHAHDYRYFPEPDLLPIEVSEAWLHEIRAHLGETPRQKRDRFVRDYQITPYDAHVLTLERDLADYYEKAAAASRNPKAVANWVMTELLRELADRQLPIGRSPVVPEAMAELVALIDEKTISGKMAKEVFAELVATGRRPGEVVRAKGMVQVTDTGALEPLVQQAIDSSPAAVAQYRQGQAKSFQFLVGQVMKLSRGKANPQVVVEMLKRKLGE
jgi:aspartyl-tRNA(Asn)/glutamyl-tRNA(Gln) amidotransferase subunit B